MDRIVNEIEKLYSLVLLIGFIAMMLVIGGNVLLRYMFSYSITWSNSFGRYAYIYIVFMGTAVGYKQDGHAVVGIVYDAVPAAGKVIFDVFHYILMILYSLFLILRGTQYAISMWPTIDPILHLSLGIVYLAVPISAFALLLFSLSRLINRFKKG